MSASTNLKVVSIEKTSCCGAPAKGRVIAPVEIRAKVQEYYAEHARGATSCCGSAENQLYEAELLVELPEDISNFTLGCGDPITLAQLQPGESVLDLGSGGGLDCFLAARQVGLQGRVIGIDMTTEMLARARAAAERLGMHNVEFRQGYLEEMPVDDASVDVIISNCVINLSPDKPRVFAEMFRALKPGGRVSVSDIVTNGELPKEVRKSMVAWGACVAGALEVDKFAQGLRQAGFVDVQVNAKDEASDMLEEIPVNTLFSAAITARKPK
ncbi:MAG: arsenite methyltransferase [Anaerolineales bacterium]|nr:arsenite methyltransferase [Anaerolineales bacterium]